MAGFANLKELVDTEESVSRLVSFRKVPAVATAAGVAYDYSMCPGNPAPQYYASTPLTAQTLARSTDGGIDHGGPVSPKTKYLRKLLISCVTAGGAVQRMMLLDYLLFYPFVDMGTSDAQTFDNTNTLTRYTSGEGVQIMAVLVAPHGLVGDSFTVTYTNQDGVGGRVSGPVLMTNGSSVNGTILTTQRSGGAIGYFLPLQQGDTGVRSVESVQCVLGTDVGLFTMVLVKPLCDISLREITAPMEIDFYLDRGASMPVIEDDAYLGFITMPVSSLSAAALNGLATFTWK